MALVRCETCRGSGDEMQDSMTALGIPGGWVPVGPCHTCEGSGLVSEIYVYRVGGQRWQPHWAHRWHVDRWFRSWQAEWPGGLWCPRSWTPAMVRRKAERWIRRHTDLKKHERKYGPNPVARAMRGES